ncbi:hypothetical protein BgiBS90_004393, partial [Biomphalaria glabrata]
PVVFLISLLLREFVSLAFTYCPTFNAGLLVYEGATLNLDESALKRTRVHLTKSFRVHGVEVVGGATGVMIDRVGRCNGWWSNWYNDRKSRCNGGGANDIFSEPDDVMVGEACDVMIRGADLVMVGDSPRLFLATV